MKEAKDTPSVPTANFEPTISLKEHLTLLRAAEDKFDAERDRRYTEAREADAKALKIKEQADRDALELAREIQTYKDEKANELREQINNERGLYVTQTELKPINDFVAQQQGRSTGAVDTRTLVFALIGTGVTILGAVFLIINNVGT